MKLKGKNFIVNAVLLIVSAFMFGPMLTVLNISVKNKEDFLKTPFAISKTICWRNFLEAWTQADMAIYFKNSIVFTSLITVGVIVLTVMAAFPIARNQLRFSKHLYLLFMAGLFLPVSLVALIIIMKTLHLLNTYHGYIMFMISFNIPISIFIFNSFISGVPEEMDEAAVIDGCGYFRYVFTILIPLMLPAISTVGMLTALATWNDFIYPYLLLTDRTMRTLTSGLYVFVGEYFTNWTVMCAGIIIVAAPIIVLYIFLQRFIISGVTSGALKG